MGRKRKIKQTNEKWQREYERKRGEKGIVKKSTKKRMWKGRRGRRQWRRTQWKCKS
jgi:hypothetical protein